MLVPTEGGSFQGAGAGGHEKLRKGRRPHLVLTTPGGQVPVSPFYSQGN